MRPLIKQALHRAWRDHETLQLGVVPEDAVVLEHAGPAVSAFLDLLDGTRDDAELGRQGELVGLGRERSARLLRSLDEAGVLDDAEEGGALAGLPGAHRARLAPDLAALSLVRPAGAPALLAARRRVHVEVRGAGRVGAGVAAVLAAAGIGRVETVDHGRLTSGDCSPCGTPPSDVGRLRTTAAREAVRRAAGGAGTGGPHPGASPPERGGGARWRAAPDLVVLAPRHGLAGLAPDPEESLTLTRSGTPHLYAGVVERLGLVGPLVLPGAAACGGCAALHRADRDPAWPRLLAQLASRGPSRAPVPACDTALATTVAGMAAMHVLMFLAGGRPPSVDGAVEISLADGSVRRRPLPVHPDCGCAWSAGGAARETPRERVAGASGGPSAGTVRGRRALPVALG